MSTPNIVTSLITIDRTLFGKENYLTTTIDNLGRSNFFTSKHHRGLRIFDSIGYAANENAGRALLNSGELALERDAQWVLFLEDDLDFCADFLDGVSLYLSRFATEEYRIISLACPYNQVTHSKNFWLYPIDAFFGTQCFAIRPHDAISLGSFLFSNPTSHKPTEYDLMVYDWMRVEYPHLRHHLASAPSFVQHIGRESICTDLAITHQSPSWPGREWSYK